MKHFKDLEIGDFFYSAKNDSDLMIKISEYSSFNIHTMINIVKDYDEERRNVKKRNIDERRTQPLRTLED